MSAQNLRVLLIDDDDDSQVILNKLLSRVQDVTYTLDWVNTYEKGLQALQEGRQDVCLLDYRLGARNGLEFLHHAYRAGCRVPIIMLTGQGNRAIDVQAMKAGAVDYLIKDGLTCDLLERALRYAVERRWHEEQRLRNEAHLQLLTHQLSVVLWTTDETLCFTSSLGEGLLGRDLEPNAVVGQSLFSLFQAKDRKHSVIAAHDQALQGQSVSLEREWDGRTYHARVEPLHAGNGHVVGTVGVAVDISDRRRMEGGFRFAREIQQQLLPAQPPILPGFDIAGACHPAEFTGGDFFDYLPMHGSTVGIVVADVSSHGFGPALIMAATRRVLRTLAQENRDLEAILKATNRAVVEDTCSDLFVTMLVAQLDPEARSVVHAGAGHEGYLLDPSGEAHKLESTSPPLGVMDGLEFPCAQPVQLEPGQILVFLTDGFSEATTREGNLFGIEQALAVIHTHRDRPAAEILAILHRTVCEFCSPDRPHDDVTGVVVKVLT